jgi:FkbM family methyltransferase
MLRTVIPKLILELGRLYNRHTNFRRGRRAHSRLICWGIKNLGFRPPVIRLKCGMVFEYSPEVAFDVLPSDLVLNGEFEPRETRVLREFLPQDGVFIDVGANIGYFSILAAKWVGPNGRVFAFEPVTAIYKVLSRNIALNTLQHVVSPLRLACFSSFGEMSMKRSIDSGKSHLIRAAESNDEVVSLTTVDHFVEQNKISRIDCIKIDAEGSDLEVLKGCKRVIARFRPPIIIETDNLERFGGSAADVREFFYEAGYSISEMKIDHSLDFVCLPKLERG